MKNEEIVKWLRSMKVETGSLLCLGCCYENSCSIHGCAVMRAAADAMENHQTENDALRRHIDNLTDAQVVVVKEFEAELEELHEAKSELQAAVRVQETLQKALKECKAERDAAARDLHGECSTCEHVDTDCPAMNCRNGEKFKWRGTQKEEPHETTND